MLGESTQECIEQAVGRLASFSNAAAADAEAGRLTMADVEFGVRYAYRDPPDGTIGAWIVADVLLLCAAVRKMSDGRKVRRLKWRHESYGWAADTPWGRYLIEISKWPGARGMWYVTFRCAELEECYYDSIDDAEKACQTDFDRRVMECME